jgi:hypothetical protein
VETRPHVCRRRRRQAERSACVRIFPRPLQDTEAGILLNEHIAEDGPTASARACQLGAEGIVSKEVDGTYRSGPCRVWIKVRNPASIAVARTGIDESPVPRARFTCGYRSSLSVIRHSWMNDSDKIHTSPWLGPLVPHDIYRDLPRRPARHFHKEPGYRMRSLSPLPKQPNSKPSKKPPAASVKFRRDRKARSPKPVRARRNNDLHPVPCLLLAWKYG